MYDPAPAAATATTTTAAFTDPSCSTIEDANCGHELEELSLSGYDK